MKNVITMYYSHNRENDTKLVYSFDEHESHLDMRYTDEDPDYGTDYLEWNSGTVESLHEMATSYLEELTEYLDDTSDGIRRPGEASLELEMVFGEYSNSTLYAIENALRTIVGEQSEVLSADGNLLQVMTVREAAKIIKDTFAKKMNVHFDIGVDGDGDAKARKIKEYAQHAYRVTWFGCKLIRNDNNLFDDYGYGTDYLFVVGHYGGGNLATAYYASDEYASIAEQSEDRLVEAMCESMDIAPCTNIVLETVEHKEEK